MLENTYKIIWKELNSKLYNEISINYNMHKVMNDNRVNY